MYAHWGKSFIVNTPKPSATYYWFVHLQFLSTFTAKIWYNMFEVFLLETDWYTNISGFGWRQSGNNQENYIQQNIIYYKFLPFNVVYKPTFRRIFFPSSGSCSSSSFSACSYPLLDVGLFHNWKELAVSHHAWQTGWWLGIRFFFVSIAENGLRLLSTGTRNHIIAG